MDPSQPVQYSTDGDRALQDRFVAVLIVGLVLDISVLVLRLYARRKWNAGFARDDALLLAAFAPLIAYVTASLFNIHHMRDHTPSQAKSRQFIVAFLTCIIAYALNTMLVKLSILSFYCRVFNRNKGLVKFSWILAIIVVMFNLALVLVAALQCIPLSAAWTNAPGKCINLNQPLLGLGIVNVVMDSGILFIPVRAVLQLQMNAATKLQVCGVFLTGAIVCIFSIFRVTAVTNVKPQNRTYTETWSGLVSFCEMFVGVIAACLPMFGRFFSRDKIQTIVRTSICSSARVWPSKEGRSKNSSATSEVKASNHTSQKSADEVTVYVQETTSVVRDDKFDHGSLP